MEIDTCSRSSYDSQFLLKRIFDFSPEWLGLIRTLMASSRPRRESSKWIEMKYGQTQEQICSFSRQNFGIEVCSALHPSWKNLLTDLQEMIPLMQQSSILYKSRISLLPSRIQVEILVVIERNFFRIDTKSIEEFSIFLFKNLEEFNDWAKVIVKKYFRRFATSKLGQANEMREKLSENKGNLKLKDRFENIMNLAENSSGFCTNGENSSNGAYRVFLKKVVKSENNSKYSESRAPKMESQEIDGQVTASNVQRQDNNCNFDGNMDLAAPEKEPEEIHNPQKRQKLDRQDFSSNLDLPVSNSVASDNIDDNVQRKSVESSTDNYLALLNKTGELSRVMLLEDLLQKRTDFETACQELSAITTISVEHIESLCSLIDLRSLNEESIIFFLRCLSSDLLNLSSMVKKKFLSESVYQFLLRIETGVSRSMFASVLEMTERSKEPIISSVLLPLMTKITNAHHEEFILRFFKSCPLQKDDIAEILDTYLAMLVNDRNAISESTVAILDILFGKQLNLSTNTLSNFVSVFEMNFEAIKSSNKFLKLVITLTKSYPKDIAPFKDRLVILVEKNMSFLKKTALASLRKI